MAAKVAKQPPSAALIGQLANMSHHWGGSWARRKRARLISIKGRALTDSRALREYHELLLMLSAFPDDPAIRKIAASELDRVAATVAVLPASRRASGKLKNSGIAGTILTCAFGIDVTRWLSDKFPGSVQLVWDDDTFASGLDDFFQDFITVVEQDGIRSERVAAGDWFRMALTGNENCPLKALVQTLDALDLPGRILNQLFNSLEVEIRWSLTDRSASRTYLRFPERSMTYCDGSRQPANRLRTAIRHRLPKIRPLSVRAGQQVIDVARASLAVRERETDGITYANPQDVALFQLGRGIDVALFGTLPSRRSPIESYFAYMIAKNRVPVGYGGGWVFGRRLEIGGNVFPEFRGVESDHLMTQVLRVFHQHLGSEQIFIDPVQFGYDNEEAIASGAFWFYFRLGFRPTDAALADLAVREWRRIQTDRRYRSPPRVLRRLAEGKLCWLANDDEQPDEGPSLSDIGLAVTRHISAEFGGDRSRAFRWAAARLRRILPVVECNSWPACEQAAYRNLSLLVAMIGDLSRWSAHDRRRLVGLMRAKGGRREVDYVRRLREHPRVIPAFASIATRAAVADELK